MVGGQGAQACVRACVRYVAHEKAVGDGMRQGKKRKPHLATNFYI